MTERSPYVRFPTYMSYAKHPTGPWSTPVMVYSGSDQAQSTAPATGDTNMAPVIFPDGSLIGIWRGDRKEAGRTSPAYQYQYLVKAGHWKDPSSYRWGNATKEFNIFPELIGPNDTRTCGIEDPSLWVDKKGVIHAVLHNWNAGAHAASADQGKTWRFFGGKCSSAEGPSSLDWSRSLWPATVAFSSGDFVTPHRRERPHLVVANNGDVVALTNGVEIPNDNGAEHDRTYTLVQQVLEEGKQST